MRGYERWFLLAALLWAVAGLTESPIVSTALACAALPLIWRGLRTERAAGVRVRWMA